MGKGAGNMRAVLGMALLAALAACSGTMPAQGSSGGGSGITVFGTVDSSVTHTR